jgi:amino acid permease
MIRLNLKIQFVLLAVSLFFIGLGINEIFQEGFKTDISLFRQLSPIVPFVIFSFIFIRNIYIRKQNKKDELL